MEFLIAVMEFLIAVTAKVKEEGARQVMEILIAVAAKVREYTIELIGQQAGYLIFCEGNFKVLVDHVKELEDVREKTNHLVNEERRNEKEIDLDVLNWLEKVNEIIEKANQLQEDPRLEKVWWSKWSFPNFILRYQLSKEAINIAKDVVQVKGKRNCERFGYLSYLDQVGFSSSTRGGMKLETRESFKEEIVMALKDPNARNIGIYGLGGVGKTTLVKEVLRRVRKLKLFNSLVISRVSKTPNIKIIQGEIADLLGLRFEEESVAGRAYRLRERILAEKTILIILDDIQARLDLEKVGIPCGNEHNGCKLLMTSRNEDVLFEMDVEMDFTFRLELLGEAETWDLFQFMAGDLVKDKNLEDIAIQVAKKCAGLPLRIVTVARALRNKRDVQFWKDALRQLQSIDHVEMDEITYSALELSYNSLENHEMKALFLLFAILQGSDAEYLLKVAIGLDIFKHINTVDEARNRLHKIIGSLKASCLLLEDKTSERPKMHDIIREVAISIACRDEHVFMRKRVDELKEWPTKDFLKCCPQIILDECHINQFPQSLYCPNVKLFILDSVNRSLEIPDTIFEGMGNLTVLDLTYLNLSSLPSSFQSLTSLQTLCLDHCVLENMDAIGSLKNLEILSLRKSSMIKLPSVIRKLTRLRMLDLSHSGIEVIPPNIISSLTKLEELYMGNTSIKWEDENLARQNKNASLAELRKLSNLTALDLQIHEAWILPRDLKLMFEKLTKYKIAIGDVWEWSNIKDGTLKTLKLKLDTNIHLEHGIKALIKGVENLYLDEVYGIQNVLYKLNGDGFPLLKHLHVQNNAYMKYIVDSMERNQVRISFINLETLVLHNLKNLEEICHGQLELNSFGRLRVIKVKNCIQLKYLLSFLMVKGLSQLSEIDVFECNSMKMIMVGDRNASASSDITEKIEFLSLRSLTLQHLQTLGKFFSNELISSTTKQKNQRLETRDPAPFFNAQVVFPNLDTLKLGSLNLNKIWEDSQQSMCNLTSLIVENCGGLKYLFSSSMVGSFINLKRLEVSKCHLMEEIIATEERNNDIIALQEVRFAKLETVILKDMENLQTIWHCQFDRLNMLQVQKCHKIVVVIPSSMQKTYRNLEMLEVTDCALVEEIFELTSSDIEDIIDLKGISLDGLPKLKRIWSKDPKGILNFCNLENVQVNQCESLEYIFPLYGATCLSHLKELHIKDCGNMQEIVAEKKDSVCPTPIFEFNQLSSLLLWNLCKLKCFYAGNHALSCPSLRTIDVMDCENLNLYQTESTSSPIRFCDGYLQNPMQQPLFIVEEVIPNLEKLRINQMHADMILQVQHLGALFPKMTFLGLTCYQNEETIFPYQFLQVACCLEWLVIEWSFFKKIFQDESLSSEKIHTRLKKLTLFQLPKLQHICEEGSQIHPALEVLEDLFVTHCPILTSLLPSSATFNHLTYLEISDCDGLINLITSPTARSLSNLTTLMVKNCNSLEEIIKGKESVDIAFISLEILMLECLPSLNKFCSSECFLKFPMLVEVVVRECPCMKIFSEGNTSTSSLKKVKIAENDEEWHWKGNLNDTIKNMFEDKVSQ